MALALIAIPLSLAGCGKRPVPPPPINCSSAFNCLETKDRSLQSCGWSADNDGNHSGDDRFGKVPGDIADRAYDVLNFHATRRIVAVLKTTIQTQLPDAPVEAFTPLLLQPTPKGRVRGGLPDRIDYGGPAHFLGCEYVRSGTLLQKYSFEIVKACFEEDTACQATPPYEKPEKLPPVDQQLSRCENLCNDSKSECLVFSQSRTIPDQARLGNELFQLHRQLTRSTAPFSVPLNPVFDSISKLTGAQCSHRMMEVTEFGQANAFGARCPVLLGPAQSAPPEITAIRLDIPTLIKGSFVTSPALAKWQFDPRATATLDYFSDSSPKRSEPIRSDKLAAMYFAQNRLILAGANEFCARIDYNGG